MLCVSILSEVVLGFMLWSGVLGGAYPTAPADNECNCAPCSCKENCKCDSCPCDACPGKPGAACAPACCAPACPTGCGPGVPCALGNPMCCPADGACPGACVCPASGACGNSGACPFTGACGVAGACPFAGGCPFANAPLPAPCCLCPGNTEAAQPPQCQPQAPACRVLFEPFLIETPFSLTAPACHAGGQLLAVYDNNPAHFQVLTSRVVKRGKNGVLELHLRTATAGKQKAHIDASTAILSAAQAGLVSSDVLMMNPQRMNAFWQPMHAPMQMCMPAPYMPFAMPPQMHTMAAPMPAPSMPVAACPYPLTMPQTAARPGQQCRLPDPMPMPPFPQAAMPPQGVAYPATVEYVSAVNAAPAAPAPQRATVRLVFEAGKAQLCVKSHGLTTQAVRMKLEAGSAGSVRLAAGKNLVHISGSKWKAQADRIELGDDGRVVLAGHVKLSSDKLGSGASVKADRMCVQVKSGKFETIVEQK